MRTFIIPPTMGEMNKAELDDLRRNPAPWAISLFLENGTVAQMEKTKQIIAETRLKKTPSASRLWRMIEERKAMRLLKTLNPNLMVA